LNVSTRPSPGFGMTYTRRKSRANRMEKVLADLLLDQFGQQFDIVRVGKAGAGVDL
jgi:hypothetical protein